MTAIIIDGLKNDKLEHGHNLGCLSTTIGDSKTLQEYEAMKKEIIS